MTARQLRGTVLILAVLMWAGATSWCHASVAVIGHEELGTMDKTLLSRIFTGRVVQIDGRSVQPINLKSGDAVRSSFLRAVLHQSDGDYIAYWIVRRAIGKGTPPREVDNANAMIELIRSTPGAIGYIDEASLMPGVRVLLLLP